MRIVICDDERSDRVCAEQMVERYFEGKENPDIECYPNGETLLEREEKGFDVLFLDVYMKGLDGISVARTLRERGEKGRIVLMTSARDFGPESYEIGASWYLMKPLSYERFAEALDHCMVKKKGTELKVSVHGTEVVIPVNQIDFIETEGRRVVIHMGRQSLSIYDSLERLYERLGEEDFIRPQRSYILNMAYIQCLEGESFRLMNGERVSINRSRRKEIREIYQKYLFRMLDRMEVGSA